MARRQKSAISSAFNYRQRRRHKRDAASASVAVPADSPCAGASARVSSIVCSASTTASEAASIVTSPPDEDASLFSPSEVASSFFSNSIGPSHTEESFDATSLASTPKPKVARRTYFQWPEIWWKKWGRFVMLCAFTDKSLSSLVNYQINRSGTKYKYFDAPVIPCVLNANSD